MVVLDNLFYLVVTFFVIQRKNVYSFKDFTVNLNTTNITTHQGNTIDLKALVTNAGPNKTIEVQWLRNEMKIVNTARLNEETNRFFSANVSFVISRLRITNVNLFDTGNWTFRVKVDNVSITRTATVTVFAKPILKVQRDTLLIKEGDTIFIVCYWTQNGHETSFPLIRLAPYTVNVWISTSSSDNSYAVFMKKNAYASDAGQYLCINNQTSDVYSIQSKSVDVDIYTADDTICASSLDEYGLSWSNTYGGEIKYGSCPTDKTGYSSRYCDMYGIWNLTDLSYCAENDFDALEWELDAIYAEKEDGLTNSTTISNAINSTLSGIEKISRNGSSSGGLNRTLQILSRIVTLANESDSINEESFFGSVDNILSTRNNESWITLSTKPNVSDAGTVMQLVERFSVYAKQKAKQSTRQGNSFIGKNFYLDYAVLNSTNSITFPAIKSGTSYLDLPDQRLNVSENFYIAVIYKTIGDILSTNTSNITNSSTNPGKNKMSVGTPVLSLKLDTAPDTLSPPLRLQFTTINKTGDLSSAICVYWDFAARSGRGAWKTDGCTRVSFSTNEIVCQCNHLTNFAVLMSLNSTITNAYVISTISTIGSAISIFFAILTIVMHIILWSYVKSDVTVLLMNLCAALAISYTVFVTGTHSTDNEILCTAVTFLLHFMLLVMFSMMQCIGIHYLRNIVLASIWIKMADQFSRRSSLPWYLVFGWGIPLAISLSTVGFFYSKGTYVLPNICWLSTESGSLYFFIVPAYLIVLINIIILIALIKVSVARFKPFQSLRKQTEGKGYSDYAAKARQALKNFGVLVPVLGFTWLFGILSINKDTEVFQYLFTISSSLQGIFIFLVHVPLNKKWKDAFAKKYRKVDMGKNTRQTGSESAASLPQVTSNNTAKSSLGSNHELSEVAKTTKEN